MLDVTDEQWLEDWTKENGKYHGFNMEDMVGEERKGECKDTELYDALGVAPDATQN